MWVMKYFASGVSWGCTVFVFVNLIGYWLGGAVFLDAVMADFTRQAVGSMIVGVACASPAFVYQIERLSFFQQSLIHFVVGLTVFFLVAFSLNWIPTNSMSLIISVVLLNILIFTFVWFLFYLYNRLEAKKMNRKINELINRE
ncbi:DUF3021 domain-containing protein [Lysinibacillus sp. 3P01SB]|uniref:DUF3021 domain-containing protein n=1 Tax=Lysinibacillus sp. 3P01SB TaxID=3132284 RepID=UPI0039A7691C